jgi:hypothetical protein
MALPGALRSAGRDAVVAAGAFFLIVSLVFLAGRWHLESPLAGRLVERAAAAAIPDATGETGALGLAAMRGRLTALGEPGAVVAISGAVTLDAVLDSAQPTTDPCLGCLELIAGPARETRQGDPVQVGVRFWTGSTVLTVVAGGAPVGVPRSDDLTVSLNAAGKVFFDRECSLLVESSEHAIYRTVVQGEGDSVELLELRGFSGVLECADLTNSTTGESVSLLAVFSYRAPDVSH